MTELINTFSWSISAAEDFAECHRRRYWAKYAMWNGWKEHATELQRTAYRLNKMENRFTLQGNAVEKAVMWALCQKQEGKDVTVDQAYTAAVRPFLNQCWQESRNKKWESNPKKFCCLQEHYYPEYSKQTELDMTTQMIERIKLCISNFIQKVLPRIKEVRKDEEVEITTVDSGRDPESFPLEGFKIYAIPDYAYRKHGQMHIHDWKSGKSKQTHNDQMALYGLWANVKHKVPVGDIHVHLEYLKSGEVQSTKLTQNEFERITQLIHESVSDMAEYLAGGDIQQNAPLPMEDWEMVATLNTCKRCKFYELCKPELE